ncbi:hypothetical protein L1887_40413 [Cichorium endivia]|nr:hypothetical protein L1887_40413 [Cichorium endivia]
MVKMDDQLQSHSSLPLLSKPDRMDSFIKQIRKNPNLTRLRYIFKFGRKNSECVPLNETVADNSKSYLLDRIESLEDRLIQLSLEIETRRTSRPSHTPSTIPTRELPISSYPVFNNPKPKCKRVASDILPISTGGELQKRSETLERKQNRRNGNGNDENHKTFKNAKKKAHSWPHLKILGC